MLRISTVGAAANGIEIPIILPPGQNKNAFKCHQSAQNVFFASFFRTDGIIKHLSCYFIRSFYKHSENISLLKHFSCK
jgi:hypothetical protein